jgi:FAD/FMN-containing dehydrogenase
MEFWSFRKEHWKGEFFTDDTTRRLYATMPRLIGNPQAVAIPKTEKDIEILIQFARENKTSLIPGRPALRWRGR